jgi:hypothetical protein
MKVASGNHLAAISKANASIWPSRLTLEGGQRINFPARSSTGPPPIRLMFKNRVP